MYDVAGGLEQTLLVYTQFGCRLRRADKASSYMTTSTAVAPQPDLKIDAVSQFLGHRIPVLLFLGRHHILPSLSGHPRYHASAGTLTRHECLSRARVVANSPCRVRIPANSPSTPTAHLPYPAGAERPLNGALSEHAPAWPGLPGFKSSGQGWHWPGYVTVPHGRGTT